MCTLHITCRYELTALLQAATWGCQVITFSHNKRAQKLAVFFITATHSTDEECHDPPRMHGCLTPFLRPLTHTPKTSSRNRCHRPKFNVRFWRHFFCADARCIDCLQVPKAVSDVRSHALARKTGAGSGIKFMVPISGACVTGFRLLSL